MVREFHKLGFWKHHALTAALAFILLTLARSNGVDNDATFLIIAIRSAVHVGVSYPLFTVGAHIAMTGLPNNIPLIIRAVVGCLAITPLITLISPVITWSFGAMPSHVYIGPTHADLIESIQRSYWRIFTGFSTLGVGVWIFLNFEWWRGQFGLAMPLREPEPTHEKPTPKPAMPESTQSPESSAPKFMKRLSAERRGELWALTAEQHYLRVYTRNGDDLILMRFSDAIAELENTDGLQIHRSHWVSKSGVVRIDEEGQRLFVVLKNDVRLPVSRPNIAATKLMFHSLDTSPSTHQS